jgi:cytochrome c556
LRGKENSLRLLAVFILAGAVLAQAPSVPSPQPASPLKSVGTMSELMLDLIYPTSDQIFYVARNENKTVKDWNDIRQSALMLAEAANLLMTENRARDKDQWMKDAKLLWEAGNKAFILAKAKDEAGLEALNAELYETCQSCHVHYRPGYRRRP